MKKAASYKVDIKITQDAVVDECQCECGAGQGPSAHCKHVCAILYGLTSFCRSGSILTELTCTQTLQTFHKAKSYKGSPLKSEGLQAIRGKDSLVYDPRPPALRQNPNYANDFRNLCINYASQHQTSMPVLQAFPPANIRGVAHDHDYLYLSPQDQFLKERKLFQITSADVDQLEQQTRGQARNPAWLEARLFHITASNFGTICKATERRDMNKLVTSLITPSSVSSIAMRHGQKMEPVAVEKFEELRNVTTQECGLFVCEDFPFIAASPDRIVNDSTLLEVKCPYVSRDKAITPVSVPYLKLDKDTLVLDQSHDYYYQIQGQLLCSNRSLCFLYVYTLVDSVVVKVMRNDDFIASMVTKLRSFYDNFFRDALLNRYLFHDYHNYSFHY